MEAAPYDNVEFGPTLGGRKPGTGTWPGPLGQQQQQQQQQHSSRILLHQPQTLQTKDRTGLGGPRLAPLEESLETPESHDQRMQAVTQQASSITSATTTTSHVPQSGFVGGGFSGSSCVASSTPSSNNALLLMSSPVNSVTSTTTPVSTTTSTKATSSNTSSNSKATQQKTTKTAAAAAPTYMLTQVGSGGVKDATAVRSGDDDYDFKRHDLDPPSRAVLEGAFTHHREFYRLNSRVLDEGSLLKQDVLDIYRKAGETFSYEQLLQGMLEDGEMLLLGGCWLHYIHVEFKDETGEKSLRQPYGKGRLCLTSNRVLLLSSEIYTDANLEPYGGPEKDSRGYKLEVSKRNAIIIRNIPLSCFQSAELEANIGTSAQTKITSRPPPCCGLCSCLGLACCSTSWRSTPPMTRSFNERMIRMGALLPPWGARTILVLHLDPGQSLTTARDFLAQLHQHAPNMH